MRSGRIRRASVLLLAVIFLTLIGVATVLAPYQYTFFGLYSEDGTYSGSTDVTVYFDNDTSSTFTVNVSTGSALDFDGGNDYVRVANSASLNVSEITVEVWLYPHASGNQRIACNGDWNDIRGFTLYKTDSRWVFVVGNGTNAFAPGVAYRPTVTLNGWQHIVWTYNMTSEEVTSYKDGALYGSESAPLGFGAIAGDPDDLYLGSLAGGANWYNGVMDELRIYNRTLTSTEVAQNYNLGYGRYTPVDQTELNLWFHMDEGAGVNTADSSGNGNAGILGTGVPANPNAPTWVSGHVWDAYTVMYGVLPVGFEWNVSYVNVSRYFIPTGDIVEVFWLFDLDAIGEDYLFTVYAYQALLPAWLETARHVNDTERTIERRTINATQNQVPMVMVTGATYFVQIRGSDGTTYDFGIFVPGSNDPTLRLNPITFSSRIQMAYRYMQVEGTRNSTNERITVNVNDELNESTWLDLEIQFKNGTIAWEANSTPTGPSNQFQWTSADNTTNYIGVLEVAHDTFGNLTHYMQFPLNPSYGQPFNLTFLGTTPADFPQSDLISIGIMFSVAAVFSTVTAPIGGFMIVLTAATLYQLGWVNWSTDLMIMAMALVVMFTVHRARRGG